MPIVTWIWVLIPLAAIFASVLMHWMKIKEKQLEIMGRQAAEKGAQYAAQTERLEQRVQVLERIATDKGVNLAQEIELLRDRPPLN